jgi:hypothetical protein
VAVVEAEVHHQVAAYQKADKVAQEVQVTQWW